MGYAVRLVELNVEQGTEQWHIAKLGHISASTAELLLVEGKNEYKIGSGLQTLIKEKVAELLTVDHGSFDGFITKSAQRGIEEEPIAREEYQRRNLTIVEEVGFIKSEEHYVGFSPDGYIRSAEKGVEIKNYDTKNHLEIVMSGKVPKKVNAQCQFSMAISGFKSWDAVFYDRRVIPELSYRQFTIERDEEMIKAMLTKSIIASNMIKDAVEKYL